MPVPIICATCQQTFHVFPGRQATAKFCSRDCYRAEPPALNDAPITDEPAKVCRKCHHRLPLTAFNRASKASRTKDGMATWCKACTRVYLDDYEATKLPEAICRHCQQTFRVRPRARRKGYGNFCSRACFFADRNARRLEAIPDLFWAQVDQSGGPEACWLWQGSVNRDGYGAMRVDGKYWGTHRLVWTLTYGEIPEGLVVCHRCDHPACVNPAHLFLGTQQHNITDAVQKGRWTQKLLPAQVRAIRALQHIKRADEVGRMFAIKPHTVRDIWAKRSWKHL
jgi:hypothetical protein